MEIDWAHFDVVGGGVVFGEVITVVVDSLEPVDAEVALADPILDPVETHVHSFGAFDFYSSVGKSVSGGVVGGDTGGL